MIFNASVYSTSQETPSKDNTYIVCRYENIDASSYPTTLIYQGSISLNVPLNTYPAFLLTIVGPTESLGLSNRDISFDVGGAQANLAIGDFQYIYGINTFRMSVSPISVGTISRRVWWNGKNDWGGNSFTFNINVTA